MVGLRMRKADRHAGLGEQVDDGRAAQQQIVAADAGQEPRLVAVAAHALEGQVQGELAALLRQQGGQPGPVDIDEMEFFGKGEVLGQQAQGRMRTGAKRDQRIVLRVAGRRQRHAIDGQPRAVFVQRHVRPRAAQEQGVEQGRAHGWFTIGKHAQIGEPRLVQMVKVAAAAELDAEQGAGTGWQAQAGRRVQEGREMQARNGQRRQGHVICAGELAGDALHRLRAQYGAARYVRQLAATGRFFQGHAHDGTRGKRPQVVRIQGFEQGIGELRIGVVEALGNAGREQGDGLDQPLDVRVFARLAGDQQAPGRFRVAAGKRTRVLAEQAQLTLVIRQQLFHVRALRQLESFMLASGAKVGVDTGQ